ncbi:DNA-binding transcriptional regulator, MocR family, contains an aminotransferase domain [Microlunatus flavus]|uniref:DNA-binding transcriptional regulator, MocR family, contains an aminotransferase domain n=1 Tax=Microlunatus flavus TaxID=1036181 RepID=A0A1H9B6X0_9ACTN|nr:DNA-binding transcriptional regulator, MocR family, contains an aminotransferase domain [Microlunatus flavus]
MRHPWGVESTPGQGAGRDGSQPPVLRRQDTRLDSYVDRYAARTHGMTASAIRALFAVANRPEVVSLAGGMPNIADLPLDVVGSSLQDLVLNRGLQAMQYGSGQGEPEIREAICEVMRLEGISAHPDDVTVTVGSQQALDLATRIFCDPGDVVLCEAPSYVGALGVFRSYQCDVAHVAMDEQGLVPEALREAVLALRAAGRKVKFVYTIPSFHNPAGVTQSLERREAILAVAEETDLLVVEDNPYGLLGFDADPIPAIRSLSDDRVVYLGTFSKTFAPGFRIGWVLAPHAVREKLVLAQESATLCPPTFSQFAITAYLAQHDWQGQIKVFAEMYRERRDAMLAGLADNMPAGVTWTVPAGGFYVWVTLPPGFDAQAMLPRAVTARVAYVPGTAFYADGFGSRHLRLSYCFPTPERILEGTRRLGDVLAREADLMSTFGTSVSGPRTPELSTHLAPGTNQA